MVKAELTLDGKITAVEYMLSKKATGACLAFVGDGVGDAPVMAHADIGIALGAVNEYSAIDAADVVLMDVPCSGLGVMGKKRDIKYHATPESLQSITELQRQIVAAGWQYVKPHGVLLYSTCTIHRGENQEMAAWITENFPFVLEEERQLLPGTDETDGFYFARLRRRT